MNDIRIIRSGISVYEVEVDLGRYSSVTTAEIGGFKTRLLRVLPSLKKHECYAGEVGGFVSELERGTDLAHVLEHVILELLKLAAGSRRRFTGWTRKKSKNHVIHFQAPNARAAREATALALEVIEGVIQGTKIDAASLVAGIRKANRDQGRAPARGRSPKVRGPRGE